MRSYTRVPAEERFWRVVDRGEYDECWLFTADARMGGKRQYGSFGVNLGELECEGKRGPKLAHRVAFRLVHGHWPVPQALHGCDIPLCCNAVNPKHVHEGTPGMNMAERADRFRDPRQHGKKVELAVLHLVQEGLSQNEIADELGISYNGAANVVFRAVRRHPRIAGLLVAELAGSLVETLTEE